MSERGRVGIVTMVLLFSCMGSASALAGLRVSGLFSDHMVVQRDQGIPVWGRAAPGEEVAVGLAEQTGRAVADADGRWRVDLDALPAGGPHTLVIRGAETVLTFEDVMVGEVWVASGQSNMFWPLKRTENGSAYAAAADHPGIRLLLVRPNFSPEPVEMLDARWARCAPHTAEQFSATAFHFGVALHEALGVPVGLIQSARNGSRAELWMHPEALARVELAERRWPRSRQQPSYLYYGMIHPLIPYGIQGVIWYQGESNSHSAEEYKAVLSSLIEDWRARWGQEDFPFGAVQLANFREPQTEAHSEALWPVVRQAQLDVSRELPNVGLAVTIDAGEADDIHPGDKRTVGERLARWALNAVYGQPVASSGPLLREVRVSGERVVLIFDHAGLGLELRGDPPHGFALAGEDGIYHWVEARLEDDAIVLVSPDVPAPVSVRYGWDDNPRISLYNAAGLPASPFAKDF